MKFYSCSDCGVVFSVAAGAEACECAGLVELTANTTDAAQEKHVPAVEKNGRSVLVKVGSVAHPMLEEHYIQWIALETSAGVQIKYLKPGQEPCAAFELAGDEEPVAAYEYCNLHGLWKAVI